MQLKCYTSPSVSHTLSWLAIPGLERQNNTNNNKAFFGKTGVWAREKQISKKDIVDIHLDGVSNSPSVSHDLFGLTIPGLERNDNNKAFFGKTGLWKRKKNIKEGHRRYPS